MKYTSMILGLSALIPSSLAAQVIVQTDAYSWHGDTVTQGEYEAIAVSPRQIVSTYHAKPGYYMGIEPEWRLKNDISDYPALSTPNVMHQAIYNMGLDEMVNAVEPDTTLRTGAAWGGVWTRDVSYSILLSMAYLQPEASRISLMRKVDSKGRIIQDTGSGGAWPISTDREIWTIAAYEVYKATGYRKWLEYIYPVIKRSLDDDALVAIDEISGLVRGETSFIDWREQSHPRWMQTADIAQSETLNTSVVHVKALRVLADIARELGHISESALYAERAQSIADAINEYLWMPDKGYYAMYRYGRDYKILNPRAETLGESLAILWNIASPERARLITENNPTTPFGVGIFYPQIADMPPYHNNALWPWVASWWAMANAKVGNEQGVMEAVGSVFRPAALFCTNKENFVLDNGDIATELNSSNMLWCLAGNIALTHKILFGINFEVDGLAFHPFVPEALAADRSLTGFRYRDAILDITISGYGDEIKSFKVDGRETGPFVRGDIKGRHRVDIVMADNKLPEMKVNRVANKKAPVTPMTRLSGSIFEWNPIGDVDHYEVIIDGRRVARTRTTTYDASVPGEYQLIAVMADGTESFASEPLSTRKVMLIEMPGEAAVMQSPEVAYPAEEPIAGYSGNGFVETDHTTGNIDVPVTVDRDGDYVITLRYANGNGSVYTENKTAVRTLNVDGKRVGAVVMPQRGEGNWNDWGWSTSQHVKLEKGTHLVTISFEPENENMNMSTNHALIDAIKIVGL
ncbi:MAG: glycogen debranching protein [Bacteroidales bacterium]|nr:glycogen debranching protein [Bacteroidales bacterium]